MLTKVLIHIPKFEFFIYGPYFREAILAALIVIYL